MIEVFLHIQNREVKNVRALEKAFNSLTNGKYLMKITRANHRTVKQNAYYWSCVVPMIKDGLRDIGYSELSLTDVHEILKMKFLKVQVPNLNTGEVLEYTNSTTKLSTVLFMDYLESIFQWAAENLGINIPAPNTQMEMNYE